MLIDWLKQQLCVDLPQDEHKRMEEKSFQCRCLMDAKKSLSDVKRCFVPPPKKRDFSLEPIPT